MSPWEAMHLAHPCIFPLENNTNFQWVFRVSLISLCDPLVTAYKQSTAGTGSGISGSFLLLFHVPRSLSVLSCTSGSHKTYKNLSVHVLPFCWWELMHPLRQTEASLPCGTASCELLLHPGFKLSCRVAWPSQHQCVAETLSCSLGSAVPRAFCSVLSCSLGSAWFAGFFTFWTQCVDVPAAEAGDGPAAEQWLSQNHFLTLLCVLVNWLSIKTEVIKNLAPKALLLYVHIYVCCSLR